MKIFYGKVIYILTTFIVVSFLYIMYLIFYTPRYFESQQPYQTLKDTYRVGDTLIYTAVYCKYSEYIPLSVKRNLVDGYVYPLPDQSEKAKSLQTFPVGCRSINVDVPLILPDDVPVNTKYHIEITIEYRINALQTQTRTFRTNDFLLIK